MPTINDLVRTYQAALDDATAREESAKGAIKAMLDSAKAEGRTNLDPHETARCDTLFSRLDSAEEDKRRAEVSLAAAKRESAVDNDYVTRANQRFPGASGVNRTAQFSVTRNERTYNPDNDPSGRNFLMDVAQGSIGSVQANERLAAHSREEAVERPLAQRAAGDATTAAFGVGLVVPQYLTDYYAPAIANMRPLANVVNHHELPAQGMTLNLSKITTASSAALQATQLTAVSATSIAETDLSIAVQTVAGQQNVSRQAIDRGTGIEDVTAGDLFKRVATAVDSTLITQATTGVSAAAQIITYTSGAPTGTEFWPFIFQAESKLEQALLAQARVDTVVMHPRRFNWLCSQVGSTWPFLGSQGSGVAPQQFAMQVTNEYGASIRAVLSNGLRVVVDANVPTNLGAGTNQDEIYVLASEEIHLWEDQNAPMLIRAEQPNAANLGVLLVCYQYFAYTAQRYANNPSKIFGTGLIAPAGF